MDWIESSLYFFSSALISISVLLKVDDKKKVGSNAFVVHCMATESEKVNRTWDNLRTQARREKTRLSEGK